MSGSETGLSHRVQRHLDAVADQARLVSLEPLIGGACQELFRAVVDIGEKEQTLVLRSDAESSLPDSLLRDREYQVIETATAAGVRTPAAKWLGQGVVRDGAWAYFMDWVPGQTIARKVLKEPSLSDARTGLPEVLAAQLATIHRIAPTDAPPLLNTTPDVIIDKHRVALDECTRPSPAIELALRWLERRMLPARRPVLCHGDFRMGNFAVTESGLTGILDWEFAHLGSPVEDIGWLMVRDWRFGNLGKPAFGLCSRQRFIDAYVAAGGEPVTTSELRYWEIAGNVRWAIGALYQGQRFLSGTGDLELAAIGFRTPELEYEILRLMETE